MRTSTLPAETKLPIFTTGSRSLGWLGLLFLMMVLGWCFGTLLYTYFYLRLYSAAWPQGTLPLPELLRSGLVHAILLPAAAALGVAWSACRRGRRTPALIGLTAGSLLLCLFLGSHVLHLTKTEFSPQTNAYGSIFFVLSWALELVAAIAIGLAASAAIRLYREGEHWQTYLKLHIQMATHFGYFTTAVAAVVYAALYLSPHML